MASWAIELKIRSNHILNDRPYYWQKFWDYDKKYTRVYIINLNNNKVFYPHQIKNKNSIDLK